MPTRDHQAVPLAHGIGIGDADGKLRSPAAPGRCPPVRQNTQSTSRLASLAMHTAEARVPCRLRYGVRKPPRFRPLHNQGSSWIDSMCQCAASSGRINKRERLVNSKRLEKWLPDWSREEVAEPLPLARLLRHCLLLKTLRGFLTIKAAHRRALISVFSGSFREQSVEFKHANYQCGAD